MIHFKCKFIINVRRDLIAIKIIKNFLNKTNNIAVLTYRKFKFIFSKKKQYFLKNFIIDLYVNNNN